MPDLATLATLVRLPAVLTAPGDTLLGAASGHRRRKPAATAGVAAASCCLYLAGMALNDYADRDIDARERPQRPIPSGAVSASFALRLAAGLTASGLTLAALTGGRRAVAVAVPLVATIWGYDLALKNTAAGPAAMAAARFLDVMLGAHPDRRAAALPAAAVVGAHTLKITTVSRSEVSGGSRRVGVAALRGTAAVTVGASALATAWLRRGDRNARFRARAAAAAALIGAYAWTSAAAEGAAAADASPANLQRAVGTGVLALLPLEAGLHAAAGGPSGVTAAIAAAWPLARSLARRRAVT